MLPQAPFVCSAADLRALVASAVASDIPCPCTCGLLPCAMWESISETAWPATTMKLLATLRDPAIAEPTFAEHHPAGTRYEGADAPIALKHFPYNRCDVYRCTTCQHPWLRYTEYGGYYIDHRARRLNAAMICD